jgi:glycosyltransferase involved in cell wall biosynthesis
MAAGKPCVGTRVGGIPEVIDDGVTGLLVPPHDPPSLAAALITLLKEPGLRQRMGEAALVRVAEQFSVEKMVEGTLKAYESACAAGTPL